uniref:Uncharacterized protein n=1 Tax=Alexandrium monilatum TaxID=311494 RepID=A0A7S4RVU0_9DINO
MAQVSGWGLEGGTGGHRHPLSMENGEHPVRKVRLPAGWEGLSFKLQASRRLFVAEVPKACFSSAAFGASGAKPQVEGVLEGDEIVTINDESPDRVVERITTSGDAWNSCSSSKEDKHAVGSKGKFDSPPCPACDFMRRRKTLGLDVALQMWLRAVKRDIEISLGVRSGVKVADDVEQPDGPSPSASSAARPAGVASEPRSVVVIKDSTVTGSISELKSLSDIASEGKKSKTKAGQLKECKDKGKGKGKGKKGKGKQPRPSGPDLPRTHFSQEPMTGEVVEWKGKYGWIRPSTPVDHPDAGKHKGRLYIHQSDLLYVDVLEEGMVCRFHVFSDVSGLGAEDCVVIRGADGQEWWWDGGWEDGDWEDDEGDEEESEDWGDTGAMQ